MTRGQQIYAQKLRPPFPLTIDSTPKVAIFNELRTHRHATKLLRTRVNSVQLAIVLPPVAAAVSTFLFHVAFGAASSRWLADKIKVSDAARSRFAIVASAVEVIGIGACIEAADLSKAVTGEVQTGTAVALTLLFPMLELFVLSQKALWFHDLSWRTQNQQLKQSLQQSQETTDIFASLFEADDAARDTKKDALEKMLTRLGDRRQSPPLPLPMFLQNLSLAREVTTYPSVIAGTFQPLLNRVARPAIYQDGTKPSVRATLFHRVNERLVPIVRYANNRTTLGDELLTIPTLREQPNAFSLDRSRQCLLVAAALEPEPMVVPDTLQGDADDGCPFHFTHPDQRRYTRSIVCFPLRRDGQSSRFAAFVLAIDSNVPGLFSLERRGMYGILCASLSSRLRHAVILDEMFKCLSVWVELEKAGQQPR